MKIIRQCPYYDRATRVEMTGESIDVRPFQMILWASLRVRLGEFGAFHTADLESRVRWTRFIADEAARRRMGFAYWEFCSGFGVYDPTRRTWIDALRDALIPARNK